MNTKTSQLNLLTGMLKDPEFFKFAARDIHLSDFDIPVLRLIYEISRDYLFRHGGIIPVNILYSEISDYFTGKTERRTVAPKNDDTITYLNSVFATVSEAIKTPGTDMTDYLRSKLPDFIAEARLAELESDDSLGAMQRLEKAAEIREAAARSGNSGIKMTRASKISVLEDRNVPRVGTGVYCIDVNTNWGLKPGQLALIAAGTGVGKSVSIANMAVANSVAGIHSLIITLENPDEMFTQRMAAMFGNFSPTWFKKDYSEWSEDVKNRFSHVMDPDFEYMNRITVVDGSKDTYDVGKIEAAIKLWKDTIKAEEGTDEKCLVVYIDYLNIISPTGLIGVNPSRDGEVKYLPAIMKQLGLIGRKTNTVIWTAQQLTREGNRKEVLQLGDVAFASHVIDWLDLCVGLAILQEDAEEDDYGEGENVDDGVNETRETDRRMVISFIKSRESSATGKHFTVYQGPSLKLWSSKQYAIKAEDAVSSGGLDSLYGKMLVRKK